jgi:hypothetical protein
MTLSYDQFARAVKLFSANPEATREGWRLETGRRPVTGEEVSFLRLLVCEEGHGDVVPAIETDYSIFYSESYSVPVLHVTRFDASGKLAPPPAANGKGIVKQEL